MQNVPVKTVFDAITDFLASDPTSQEIIAYHMPDEFQQRLDELLERNGEGQLTFDDQFDGEKFNSDIVTQEVFDDPSFLYMNFSVGLNWHYQNPGKRTRIDIGGSVFNLNGARQSFFNEKESELSKRIHVHGIGSFMVSGKVDLTFQGLMSWQTPYSESIVGLGLRYHLSQTMTKELSIQFGLNYRVEDILEIYFVDSEAAKGKKERDSKSKRSNEKNKKNHKPKDNRKQKIALVVSYHRRAYFV